MAENAKKHFGPTATHWLKTLHMTAADFLLATGLSVFKQWKKS